MSPPASATPPPRRGLFGRPAQEHPPVPADLEKWELRAGFSAAIIAVAVLIFCLEEGILHYKECVAPKKHPKACATANLHLHLYQVKHVSLVPEFWIGVFLAVAILVCTYINRRQILAIVVVFEGLMLVTFSPLFGLPYIILGVLLMLRASRRTKQLAASGQGPAPRRTRAERTAAAEIEAKGGSARPAASKRYTPPQKRKKSGGDVTPSVGIGRGGMIRGDFTRKGDETAEPDTVEKWFGGRRKKVVFGEDDNPAQE